MTDKDLLSRSTPYSLTPLFPYSLSYIRSIANCALDLTINASSS
jgi:hypothetical protein